MSPTDLHVVIGLGATGFSCVRFLKNQGMNVAVTDTRELPPNLSAFQKEFPDVPLSLGKLDTALLEKAATLILSPGMALSEPPIQAQLKRGIPVIGDIELFARAIKTPLIAITGTNAKSTVTTLVGHMSAAAGYEIQMGGNLGIPALDLLSQNPKTNLFVLELSSFQLETTHSLQPKVASVLNITPDHMDRYASFADYQAAKLRVYQNCHTAVCNRDDALTESNHTPSKYYFTSQIPQQNEFGLIARNKEIYLAYQDQCLIPVNDLPVKGKHYQLNALAALAIGHGFGLSLDAMLNVLQTFKGLPHRCQFVRERHQVSWYNDSKGTNVGATQAAIEGLGSDIQGKLILIAGGVGKNADFNPLLPVMKKYVRHVILMGEAADDIAKVIKHEIPITQASSMEDAILKADQVAKPHDSILLSPACASFDMFKNYEHRGEVFTHLVEKL